MSDVEELEEEGRSSRVSEEGIVRSLVGVGGEVLQRSLRQESVESLQVLQRDGTDQHLSGYEGENERIER